MNKTLIFEPARRVISGKDVTEFVFPFRLVDSELLGRPEELSQSTQHQISVVVSRTLAACWNLTDDQQLRVMYEYGKRHVIEKIREGTLSDSEEIDLHTRNTELPCPFDPERIENPMNAVVKVDLAEKKFMEDSSFLSLASSIIDARDNINAIFNLRNKDKLIVLVEERDLLQFFRDALTPEDFFYRLCALANAATQMNTHRLRRLTQIEDTQVKSIQLLEFYLNNIGVTGAEIIKTLRNITKLRQGYPVHGDRAKGVLEAHEYFSIEYPIVDYSATWKKLLKKYLEALQLLLKALKEKAA
ncbi:MAG: hypothetical protein KKG88_04910 [Proteobacteria bacterium]|nr:hypothetical protein [Pseudomonadota bacterium]MBU4413148.1 hypothetical protein [Pseudomonadota bacterium]MCG2823913.1 hypothetical protein [Desulfobulbaceae bacterium]